MALSLSMTPHQAAKMLLQRLPAKRMRDIVERRFGLKAGERETLEGIGKEYRITRERVRQIEADALRRLRVDAAEATNEFLRPVAQELEKNGGVMAEHHLFGVAAVARFHPHLHFLLQTAPGFYFTPETEECHARWALRPAAAEQGARVAGALAARLDGRGRPATKAEIDAMVSLAGEESVGSAPDARAAEAYLQASKRVRRNPYGEYGIAEWPTISPRGIRDKAHAVLAKAGAPVHFRAVATAIDRAGWPQRKKAHPQTVHNELIKDKRFVLVGRGLYALREWGYEPGTVRDVLVSLFKQAPQPLTRDEAVRLACEKRMVKPQTVLLNLQDRALFRRTEDGKYALA